MVISSWLTAFALIWLPEVLESIRAEKFWPWMLQVVAEFFLFSGMVRRLGLLRAAVHFLAFEPCNIW